MAVRQYNYSTEPPKEPLTPCISSPSTTESVTLSTTSFSYDSSHFSAQLTKVSYSKEVVKSSTLPLIPETHSGGSDNLTNGSAREGNEVNGEYDAGELYPLQPSHTDDARKSLRADVAKAKCLCCVRKNSVSPRPMNFSSALAVDVQSDINDSAVKVPNNGDKIAIERNQIRPSWYSDHTPVPRTEETNENRILDDHSSDSIDNEKKAFLCSLSAVFASIDRMDRNTGKEHLIKVHTPNSTFNKLYSVHTSKSIPIVLSPREDKTPIESIHNTQASSDRESIVCPRHASCKISSYFVPPKIEKTKLDAEVRRETASNSDALKSDNHAINLSTPNIYPTSKDHKIPQEIYEVRKGVSHPVTNENSPPISSSRVVNYPRKKENMRYMRKNEVEFPDLASFERDKFRNYIPYPISPFSQNDIIRGRITDKECSKKRKSDSTALTHDSRALNAPTPNVSPIELKHYNSDQETDKPLPDLTYSIFIEIAPVKSSSHPLKSPVENETEEKTSKYKNKTCNEEKHHTLSKAVVTPTRKIKGDAVAASKDILSSTTLERDTHPMIVSTTNEEQCDLTQKTDVLKTDISYSVIIEISSPASSPENENEENSDKNNKQVSDSVDEDHEACSDCYLHFQQENIEGNDLKEATLDICDSIAHQCCTTHTSSFEESALNQECSSGGRDVTRTETLESTMVENSALNTIYSLFSRLTPYMDKGEGTVAESKLLNSNFIFSVEENSSQNHSPSVSPPNEPEQSMLESDSFEEQILSTFSSFYTAHDMPSDEDGMENESKEMVFERESDENSSIDRFVSPPRITIILSTKNNTKKAGESDSKLKHFNTTFASSSDASVHVEREENDSKDKIVSTGRKKTLSPYPPVILSSQSNPTTLFLRGNNKNEQTMGEGPLSVIKNIAVPFTCTSAPEVPTKEEIDNKSKDSILPMGRKKKLSPFPPVVPPSVSIPIIYPNDSDPWTVAARYYSKHDNVEILYSSTPFAHDSTKEWEEKNSKVKIDLTGRKKMLSPHPPVTPPLHTKRLLLQSSEMEQKSVQEFISRDNFDAPFSFSPQFPNKEGKEEYRYKDPIVTTGRKMRLCPYSHVTPPDSQSISLRQSPKEDIAKDQTMDEEHNSKENNFGMLCSYIDVSPPNDSTNEKQSKGRIFATGRKKSIPPYPSKITPQNITRRPPQQVSENAEKNVERYNFGSLTKSISAPDVSTKDVRDGKMQERVLSSHPTMILPLKHIPAIQLEGRSNENIQTNEEGTISREINQEKYGLSLSTPNIKIRGKKKDRSGKKVRLSSSPPSTSIPLDLQQQDTKVSTSKEGTEEPEEVVENSGTEKNTILPHHNPTYNLEEMKEKEIGDQIEDQMTTHEEGLQIVSSPLPLPIGNMNENKDNEMNSEQLLVNPIKLHSLPIFPPKICNIPPYRRKSETQGGDTTDTMACDPTTPISQSIRQRTRSLLYISQAENDGVNPSKRDLSEALHSQKILREDEEQIEELIYKSTFTSFDTRLSSVSTSKTLAFGSYRIEDEPENLTTSKSQGPSHVIDSSISQAKHMYSLTKVEQETLKQRFNDKIPSIKNEEDKSDGDLMKNVSTSAKYFPVSDDRSKPTNDLLNTASHSQTPDNSFSACHERKIMSCHKVDDKFVKTGKSVDPLDQEFSRQPFSPHSSTLCYENNKKNEINTLGEVSEDTEFSQQASSPPSLINNADADRKQVRQDDNSDFLRVKISQFPPKSLTSSRRPSPYEIAPPVLKTTRRSPKVPRNEPLTAPSFVFHSPPPAAPCIEPLVVRAVPRIVEPLPISCVDSLSIPRPESSSVDPLTPPPVSAALAEASALDDAKEVLRLMRIGNDPNSTNQLGIPILVEAVHLGSLNAAAALLSCGANPNARAPGGRSALHAAADVGRHQCVSLLLRHGAHVNAVDKYKQTSLHLAARGGHEAAVLALMAGGADSRLQDANGDSVVQVAHNPELRRLIRRKTIERLRRKYQIPP